MTVDNSACATPCAPAEVNSRVFSSSGDVAKIAPALIAAQAAMDEVIKDSANPHFKSKYASLAAYIASIRPALNKHGIALLQFATAEGKVVRIKTVFLHESGQWIGDTLELEAVDAKPQSVGSATTYGRRYALASMAGVAQEDDDGNAGSGKAEAPARENGKPSPEVVNPTDPVSAARFARTQEVKAAMQASAAKPPARKP